MGTSLLTTLCRRLGYLREQRASLDSQKHFTHGLLHLHYTSNIHPTPRGLKHSQRSTEIRTCKKCKHKLKKNKRGKKEGNNKQQVPWMLRSHPRNQFSHPDSSIACSHPTPSSKALKQTQLCNSEVSLTPHIPPYLTPTPQHNEQLSKSHTDTAGKSLQHQHTASNSQTLFGYLLGVSFIESPVDPDSGSQPQHLFVLPQAGQYGC